MSAYQATLRRITQIIRTGTDLGFSPRAADEIESYVSSHEFQNIKLNPSLKRIYREFALGMAMLHHNIGKTSAKLHSVAADNMRLLNLNLQEQGLLNSIMINLRTQPQSHRPVTSRCLDLYRDSCVSSGVISLDQGSQLNTNHIWFRPDSEHCIAERTSRNQSACNFYMVLQGTIAVSRNAPWPLPPEGAEEQLVKRGEVLLQDLNITEQTVNIISKQATLLYVHVTTH